MQYYSLLNSQCIKVWSCLHLQMIEEKGRTCFDVPIFIGLFWQGTAGEGKMPLQKCFYHGTVISFGYLNEEGANKKKLLRVGYRGLCILRTGSNQFPPLLNWLICNLKFLIPAVAPIVINQVMPLLIMLDCILWLPFHLKMEKKISLHNLWDFNLRWWAMSKNVSYNCDHILSSGSFNVQSQPEINVLLIINSVITE